jgi:hypothetical protein
MQANGKLNPSSHGQSTRVNGLRANTLRVFPLRKNCPGGARPLVGWTCASRMISKCLLPSSGGLVQESLEKGL